MGRALMIGGVFLLSRGSRPVKWWTLITANLTPHAI
jgi:hypothetical protein